ncbi:hypothetical protein ON05_014790 [Acaryochloris sp. CCMEE 5410]|nr:hypothetical protein ON05_014790 [Acaryochloris sp. CCMEE 5410]
MVSTQTLPFPNWTLGETVKCFFIWIFTLTVCSLVVGFPVVALVFISGTLLALSLQIVLPMSAIALVAGCILAVNMILLMITALSLTAWGIHPHQAPGLLWLNPNTKPQTPVLFAACPLTCDSEIA